MWEMAFSALLICTNIVDAPPEEGMKPLVGILFITWPSFFDVSLQLSKNSSMGLNSGE
jgi:hypothetical protein